MSREGGVFPSTHPLVLHKLALIRQDVPSREFRSLLKELTLILGYEAARDLQVKQYSVKGLRGNAISAYKVSEHLAICPILRGGLGMTEAILDILPESPVYHIGMYRNPGSNMPIQYYNRLPKGQPSEVVFVLDPQIGQSNCINAVAGMLKLWGAKTIKIVTVCIAEESINSLLEVHPDIQIYCAAIDKKHSNGISLVPGIGDAGDRQFLGPVYDRDSDTEACIQLLATLE